jgi:hypothetical protein
MAVESGTLVPPALIQTVDRIQSCFASIPTFLEQHRQNLQTELTHYETVQKTAVQLASALDLPSPGSFADADIAKQPMGNTFFVIKNTFTRLNDELTNTTIPALRDKLNQIAKVVPKFDLFQKSTVAELRRLLQQYETELDQVVKWKRQMTSADQFRESMFEYGHRSHQICLKLCEGVRTAELATVQELKKTEEFQRSLVDHENAIVGAATELLYATLPIMEPPAPQSRTLPIESSVCQVSAQVSGLFLELRSFIGVPRLVRGDFAPKLWGEEKDPFYARVWADCQGAGEVIAVKRKELVKVLSAPNSPYWLCERTSGERGYVFTAVLEPVE